MAARDQQTIAALATGVGRAALAVIRVSGSAARAVVTALCGAVPVERRASLLCLRDQTGAALDEALVLFFAGPRSFTGEDLAEFHVHGGRAVQAAVLSAIRSCHPDVRLAEPGEFTRRAFLNGKLDLAEVEGLAALIDSETEWQRRQALRLMQGELGHVVQQWRSDLIEALALLDATLDFADEGDVDEVVAEQVEPLVVRIADSVRGFLAKSASGERLRDGFVVAITGPPNAGKSSLINAIAGRQVAIVSDRAGTTRDIVEVMCDLEGLPVRFLDTAGLRESEDPIEIEGMRRALVAAERADLVLLLAPIDSIPERPVAATGDVLVVATKCDQGEPKGSVDAAVSSVSGAGLIELLAQIAARLQMRLGGEPTLLTDFRQRECIERALEEIDSITKQAGLYYQMKLAPELVAERVRNAIRALERLIGRVDAEQVLDRVFQRFCIGK